MRQRPVQEIRVRSLQDRRSHQRTRKPWLVRWAIDGQPFSLSYRTKSEADRYRSRLLVAQHDIG